MLINVLVMITRLTVTQMKRLMYQCKQMLINVDVLMSVLTVLTVSTDMITYTLLSICCSDTFNFSVV